MAFKLLSEEDMALLTEEQRENYKREFEVHRQREVFVEKLMELENVEIEPYKPKLRPIGVMGEVDVKPYINPKRKKPDLNPVHRPMVPCILSNKAYCGMTVSEIIRPDIALKQRLSQNLYHACMVSSKAEGLRGFEHSQCVLPALSKISLPNITFTKPKDIFTKTLQTAKRTSFRVRHFQASEKTEVVVSRVSMPEFKAGTFVRPQVSQIDLTVNIKPTSVVKTYNNPKLAIAVAADMSKVTIRNYIYQQPQKEELKFNIDIKNKVEIKNYKSIATNKPRIHIEINKDIEVKFFKKPEKNDLKFDINIKNDFEVRTFNRPECGIVKLSKIHRVNVSHSEFRTPAKQKTIQTVIARPGIKAASFKNMQEIKPEISVTIKRVQPVRKYEMPVINRPELRIHYEE